MLHFLALWLRAEVTELPRDSRIQLGLRKINLSPSYVFWLIEFLSNVLMASSIVSGFKRGVAQMRVLLIEDEPTTAKAIELMLTNEGFNVYGTDLGEEGLDLGKLYDYDIILLDLNLPDMHGYDVLKKLRVAKVQTPVLILSGISEMDSKVRSFGFGADDYVTKPFHRDELVARIHAVVRRSKGHSQSVIRTGKLAVNLDAKTVEVDGSRVHLTGKEYAMLELLSLRKGTTLTKEMFLNHLYGGMDEPELKIIDVFICKLRKKLALACGGDNYIETVWGRGYVLREAEEDGAAVAA
jgi:two-component system, cell cycle response regulator CtrA